MKRGSLLNSNISAVISGMGHTDSITICDSGLPISKKTERIDISLTYGIPSFTDTLENVLNELCVEKVVIAEEIKESNKKVHIEIINLLQKYREETGYKAEVSYINHEEFKILTHSSKAVIRTGEITPYSNIILYSGVVF